MKNLKKVLSLVMALAMAMSLMATAFAADADFSDKTEIKNTEAVEVMAALGVMQGNNGKFDPNGTLTREQAAKIITYMLLGKEDADKLTADVAMYSDVKADRWSAGAIAYCTNERIMVGNGKGKFNPTAKLTGQQFAKTLLVALGYDPKIENLEGNTWAINTSKLATTAGLTDGVGALSIPMTREAAAQMAFNTLTATLVDYKGGTDITTPDGTNVTVDAERYDVDNLTGKGYKASYTKPDGTVVNTNDLLMQFCERYQTKLSLNDTTADNYGRTSNKWVFKGINVGTYADAATITYTAETKEADVRSDLKDYNNYNGTVPAWTNGNKNASFIVNAANVAALTKDGVTVEIFVSDNAISNIAVINSVFGEVTKVDTKNETITIKTDAAVAGSYATTSKNLTTEEGYNTFKKGDKVIVTAYDTKATLDTTATVTSVVAPKVVTGKATAKNTSDETIKVDGTDYTLGANSSLNLSTFGITTKYDATLYLDANGYVVAGEAGSAATNDKAIAVQKVYQTLDKDGVLINMIQGTLSSGEVVNWEYEVGVSSSIQPAANTVYTYVDSDNDDKYEVFAIAAGAAADAATLQVTLSKDITKATKSLTVGNNSKTAYFANDVKFIFFNDGKATVLDGVQKVAQQTNSSNTEVYVTLKDDNGTFYITSVFAKTTVPSSTTTSDDIIFVASAKTGDIVVTNSKTNKNESFDTYDAYINGTKVDNFYAKSGAAIGFYSAEKDNDTGAYVLTNNSYNAAEGKLAVLNSKTVSAVAGDIMTVDNKDFSAKDAVIVDSTTNDIAALSDIKDLLANKDVTVSVLFDADTNNASYIYVTNVANKVVAPSDYDVKNIQVTYVPTANTGASVDATVKTVKVNKDATTFTVDLKLTSTAGLQKAIQIDTVTLSNSYTATAPTSGDEVFAVGATTATANKTVTFTLNKGMTSDIDTLTINLKEGA